MAFGGVNNIIHATLHEVHQRRQQFQLSAHALEAALITHQRQQREELLQQQNVQRQQVLLQLQQEYERHTQEVAQIQAQAEAMIRAIENGQAPGFTPGFQGCGGSPPWGPSNGPGVPPSPGLEAFSGSSSPVSNPSYQQQMAFAAAQNIMQAATQEVHQRRHQFQASAAAVEAALVAHQHQQREELLQQQHVQRQQVLHQVQQEYERHTQEVAQIHAQAEAVIRAVQNGQIPSFMPGFLRFGVGPPWRPPNGPGAPPPPE